MKLDQTAYGQVMVLTPHGPLTGDDVDDFVDRATPVRSERGGAIVIDLHDVPYLDSRGIEALLALCTEGSVPRQPRVAQLDETCRETLLLTRVLERIEHFDTVENAVRSFKR